MDLRLPDLDGREVLATLRKDPVTEKVPVVVLTGLTEARAGDLLAQGANEFLTKPLSLTVLSQGIGRFL